MTTIKLKNGSGAPTAGDLVQGEPALDLTNKRLYTEDSGGTVIEVGTNPGTDVTFADNRKAVFGAGSDLQIYHDGSNSYINDTGTGNLFVRASDNFYVQNSAGTETKAAFTTDGAVKLYYNGGTKFQTVAGGVDVTGVITTDGMTTSADITFADSSKAIFGAGSDLQIQHTGTDSRIVDSGTGTFYIAGTDLVLLDGTLAERYADFTFGGAAQLYYDNSAKLATTSTGIDVTGTVTADGLSVDGNDSYTSNIRFTYGSSSPTYFADWGYKSNSDGNKVFLTITDGGSANDVLVANYNGNVGIGEISPAAALHVKTSTNTPLLLESTIASGGFAEFKLGASGATIGYLGSANALVTSGAVADLAVRSQANLTFATGGSTERVRIDSSGNLLVGTTSSTLYSSSSETGTNITSQGGLYIAHNGTNLPVFNRITSDGDIVDFRKNGSTVGSVSTAFGYIAVGTGDTGISFRNDLDSINPFTITGNTNRDAAIDLGASATRFKNLYLSGSTVTNEGVYFGSAVAANHLDDYEEGTCDLTWSDGTNNSTVVTNKYTKVGRIVTVSGYVAGNVSGLTSTAVAKIAGFPFAFSDYGSFAVKLRYIDSPTGCIGIVGDHANSGSVAQLSFIIDNGNYVDVLVSDLSTNSNDTYFNITYTAT
jgi:hypothetical protein